MDRQIRDACRAASAAATLEDKLAGQRQVKALEAERNRKRRSLFDAQDEVDEQREALITTIERKLNQGTTVQPVFLVRCQLS